MVWDWSKPQPSLPELRPLPIPLVAAAAADEAEAEAEVAHPTTYVAAVAS